MTAAENVLTNCGKHALGELLMAEARWWFGKQALGDLYVVELDDRRHLIPRGVDAQE